MRISQAKEIVKQLYLNTREVPALISERGVGKTSAFQQCAQELGIGYLALYAAALEGPDFMGLPDRDNQSGITRYLAPQFLPTQQAVDAGLFPAKGLIVLEEINRVPSDTVSVLYPLLLEGRINQHQLAPGWKLGVTMNPDNLNYSVNALDDALIDRFISMEITADLDDYLIYSTQNRPNDLVLSYLQAGPDMLLITRESADSDPLSKSPTPRGWTKVQNILNSCSLDEGLTQQLVAGVVGPEAAASFFGFLQSHDVEIPSAEKTLENFTALEDQYDALLKKDRIDVLNMVIKKLVILLVMQDQHIQNLNRLLEFLPEEFTILFFKSFVTRREQDFETLTEKLPIFEKAADSIIEFISS